MQTSGGTTPGARSSNVVLIGFVGAGKSTVGAILAQRLGCVHLDVDGLLEARIGSIAPYVEARGVAAFRAVERAVLATLPAGGAVISAGAGTVLHRASRARLLAHGAQVFFLDAPPEVLAARLHAMPPEAHHRPDLLGAAAHQTRAAVARVLAERRPLYRRLGRPIEAAQPPEEVASAILSELR